MTSTGDRGEIMFKRVHRDREETVRLVNELLAEGAPRAPATVLRLKRGRETSLTGLGVKQMVNITCEMDVRVEPPDGEPFETTFTQIFAGDMVGLLRSRPDELEAIWDPARSERIALDVVTFREELSKQVVDMQAHLTAWQQGGGVAGAVSAAMGAAQAPDPLRQLEALHASGAMSDADFERAKERLGAG
jgi:hypothetical protein